MKSTSEIECEKDVVIIRTSNQFEIERAIMKENFYRFTLSYSYTFLQSPMIDKIRLFAEKETGQKLMSQGEAQFEGESDLRALLSLFRKNNYAKTHHFLDVVIWQNHWKKATDSTSSSIS